jgi:hypothetical protein
VREGRLWKIKRSWARNTEEGAVGGNNGKDEGRGDNKRKRKGIGYA